MYVDQKPEVGGQQTAKQEIADDSFDCSNLTAAQLEQVAQLTAAANPGQSSVSVIITTPAESLLEIGNSSKGTTSKVPIRVDVGVGVPPSVGKIDMEMYQSPAAKPSVVVQTQSGTASQLIVPMEANIASHQEVPAISKSTTDNQSFRILEHVIIPSQQPGSIGSLCKQEQQQKATTAGGSAQCYWRVVAKCENVKLQQKPEVGGQQTAKQEIADDCSNLTAAQLEQVAQLTAAASPGQSSVSVIITTPAESLLEIGNSSKGTTSKVPIRVDVGVGVPPSVGKIDMEMYPSPQQEEHYYPQHMAAQEDKYQQSPAAKPSVVVQTQSGTASQLIVPMEANIASHPEVPAISKSTTDYQSFRILEHVIIPSQQPGSIGSLCKQEQQQKATTAGGSAQCYCRVVAVGLRARYYRGWVSEIKINV
ncbi:GL11164 [Drosophila persimilis]|uniref:GL11164 n=1 Tax=Drosophila persimilis TaxID=7234 RepID=B4GCP6_DROPE|nr:GL11164 [Drosophila persimilis]